jgi:hypothetical protein
MRLQSQIAAAVFLTFLPGSTISWAGEGVPEGDFDRDGLDDRFEQEVLLRFKPRFLVSRTECAGLPAEFLPDSLDPETVALNGTIYGQVFPGGLQERPGAYLEIHYYHLWSSDCGQFGHRLDSEYVSVLARSDDSSRPAKLWKAVYWYAAAHEGTLCDASNGATAKALDAEEKGATVWISSGKHASFLAEDLCHSFGCGGDRCEQMEVLPPGRMINLGEPGRPLNGAVWVDSSEWPLAGKMVPDFGFDGSVAGCLFGDTPSFHNSSLPPAKAVVLGGNQLLKGLEVGGGGALSALSLANEDTNRALSRASGRVGKAIERSLRLCGNWLDVPLTNP